MANYIIIGTDGRAVDQIAGHFTDAARHALSIETMRLKSGDTGNVWTREQLEIAVGKQPAPKPGRKRKA